MALEYPEHPWRITRNGKICAFAKTRTEADRIIRQLQKIYRQAEFKATYQGKNVAHCGDGGRPLD
ncbi:hypothetical protein [Thermocoleostomius sinensis]|uniref:Uncharacterized protein n=1 Tax=Thermocoleostomius sinensis A174 TaxID=2016057 RepID=A0A9E9C3J8_9CYAN|nr:hypothetical protein [Thermocoleostomius sinensis]WAL59041.1 hypothetical protein OXH18_17925 [Thermocoleostomius sinensis A174]